MPPHASEHTAQADCPSSSVQIVPLKDEPFGAEVLGLDIATADLKDTALISKLKQAFLDHQASRAKTRGMLILYFYDVLMPVGWGWLVSDASNVMVLETHPSPSPPFFSAT